MSDTLQAARISRVTSETTDLALSAWASLAAARIEPFTGETALDGIQSRIGDPGRVMLCAFDQAEPVGMALLERMPDSRIRLEAVGVLPPYRRRGIGGALLTQGLFALLPSTAMYVQLRGDDRSGAAWARDRSFRPRAVLGESTPAGMVEYELRLDTPAEGCGSGHECACGRGDCASAQ